MEQNGLNNNLPENEAVTKTVHDDTCYFIPNKTHHRHSRSGRRCNMFLALAILVLAASIICGFFFGFVETSRLTSSLTVVNERVFEWWRACLFWFVGVSCSTCLFGISLIFGELRHRHSHR